MLTELKRMLGLVQGEPVTAEDKDALMKEALLMILSRATISDSNISSCEVETVQRILKDRTGEDFEAKDIRVCAISQHYESASFDSFVASLGSSLEKADRVQLAYALRDVIKADGKTSPFEAEFFNKTIKTLKLEASDVATG